MMYKYCAMQGMELDKLLKLESWKYSTKSLSLFTHYGCELNPTSEQFFENHK